MMNKSALGKVSPVLVVLLAVFIAAGVAFVVMKNKGKSAEDWVYDAQTQATLGMSLQETKDFFGDQNPTDLGLDPTAPTGAEPTANHYLFKVQAGGDTMYFYIMHNIAGDKVLAHRESNADGPWQ